MSFTEPDADAIIANVLRRYGLEGMSRWAWDRVASGASAAEVEVELREQPEFKQRFRAITEREKRGLPPISPEEVLQYEQQRRRILRSFGFPEGFYDDPDDAVDGLVKDVSPSELEQRAALWVQHAQSRYDEETLEQLHSFGITDGSLAAFAMDEDRAMPLIQRDFATGEVAARASRAGWDLSRIEAQRLADTIEPAQASERFAALNETADVLGDRIGDQVEGLDRDTMLGIAAADPEAVQRAERRFGRARSQFQSSSGAATSQRGITGLGSA